MDGMEGKEAYWLNRKLTKVEKRPRQEVEFRRFIRRIRPTERDELANRKGR